MSRENHERREWASRSLRSLHPNNKEGNTTVRARANQRLCARSHFPTLGSVHSFHLCSIPSQPQVFQVFTVNLGLSLNVLSY